MHHPDAYPIEKHGIRPSNDDEKHVDPHRNAPGRCSHCGARDYAGQQLVEKHPPDPCTTDAQSCDCCYCPHCNSKSIYHRASKAPDYRCINCRHEFATPITEYATQHDRPIIQCKQCHKPTLGLAPL